MHNVIRVLAVTALLFGTAAPLAAATPSEFYTSLLRRGVSAYDAGRYADAAKQLRIAAFGLVEAIDQYQVAQIYLALTLEKLGDTDRAREAAHRVVVAERVERRFAGLVLPAAVRSAFDALSARLLSTTETALLRNAVSNPGAVPPPAQATPPRTTTTTTNAPRTTPAQSTPVQPTPAQTTPTQTTPVQTTPVQTTPPATQPKPAPTPVQTVKPPQTATTTPIKPAPPPASEPPHSAKEPPHATTVAPTTTSSTKAAAPTPPPKPVPATAVTTTPTPTPAQPRTLSSTEVISRLASAERALNGGNLIDARRMYREVLGTTGLDHEMLVRIAEGLYRSRDFGGALTAFNRLGTLRRGEEPYRYYIAVASYETGDTARAKKELAAALPYIEITPDVARYRAKIESAL